MFHQTFLIPLTNMFVHQDMGNSVCNFVPYEETLLFPALVIALHRRSIKV